VSHFLILRLGVVKQNAVTPSVVEPNAIRLSVPKVNAVILSAVKPNAIMLSVIKQNADILSVVKPKNIILSLDAVMLIFVKPKALCSVLLSRRPLC
jgi:hypothetical protein